MSDRVQEDALPWRFPAPDDPADAARGQEAERIQEAELSPRFRIPEAVRRADQDSRQALRRLRDAGGSGR